MIDQFRTNPPLVLVVIVTLAISFFSYSNTLHHGFVWDDFSYIIDWHQQDTFTFSDFLSGAQPGFHSGVYRPVRNLAYPLSFQQCGLTPSCYHFQAIIFHLIAVTLVVLISRQLIPNPFFVIPGLLFSLHPINVESIAWITSSFDIIGIIFALASFYLYLKHLSKPHPKLFAYRLSLLAAALAFFSNELTLILPLLLSLYIFLFRPLQIQPLKPIYFYLLAGSYLPIRLLMMGASFRHLTIPLTITQRLILSTHVVYEYIQTLIFPTNLSINHLITPATPSLYFLDRGLSPFSLSFDLTVLLKALAIISLIYLAIKQRKQQPLILFGVGWLFVSLIPIAQIPHHSILFSERYSYFASIGFAIILTSLMQAITKPLSHLTIKPLKPTVIVVIFSFLFSLFYLSQIQFRLPDWQSDFTLWSKTLQQLSNSPSALNGVGSGFLQQNDYQSALPYFKQAASLNPEILTYRINYISALEKVGDTDTLIKVLEDHLHDFPNSTEALTRLIKLHSDLGNIDQATKYQLQLNQQQ